MLFGGLINFILTNMIKLNLGSSDTYLKGYVNIDLYVDDIDNRLVDIVDDITTLEKTIKTLGLDSVKVDEIYSSHSLMCVPENKMLDTLKLWRSLLKEEGKLIIETTDLGKQIDKYNENIRNSEKVIRSLFGNDVRDGNGLRYQFNYYILKRWLMRAGFKNITRINQPEHSGHDENFNLIVRAIK